MFEGSTFYGTTRSISDYSAESVQECRIRFRDKFVALPCLKVGKSHPWSRENFSARTLGVRVLNTLASTPIQSHFERSFVHTIVSGVDSQTNADLTTSMTNVCGKRNRRVSRQLNAKTRTPALFTNAFSRVLRHDAHDPSPHTQHGRQCRDAAMSSAYHALAPSRIATRASRMDTALSGVRGLIQPEAGVQRARSQDDSAHGENLLHMAAHLNDGLSKHVKTGMDCETPGLFFGSPKSRAQHGYT